MSDLSAPLSRKRVRTARGVQTARRRLPVARLAFAGLGVLLLAFTARVVFVDTPEGGRPFADVAINSSRATNTVAGEVATTGHGGIIAIGPEMEIGEVGSALGAWAEGQDATMPVVEAAVATGEFGVDPNLVEETSYGAIPRMGTAGETPFVAYARPSISDETAGGKPRIAIIVTGLGINVNGTIEAIARLPDTITLAFAPYGKSLDRTVGAARAEGHEIFLEVPLEPFDYPENDPGPDTLLTGQAPRDNMDKLYRVMGKFGGYAGIINNMGARFTASSADFGPMMEELGARGLAYIDDGSSNRSLAPQLAEANRVPFARANMMLDANPSRAPILAQLAELEETARREGQAIGLMTALPISVATITEWAAGLEDRGFIVVPASALMQR
jgi:uncharacterized protein